MNTSDYYALVQEDADLSKPVLVYGWDDQPHEKDGSSRPYHASAGYKAVKLDMADEAWTARLVAPQTPTQLYQGVLSPYERPVPTVKEQAKDALHHVHNSAVMIVAMGGSFGPQTRDYVAKLQAIVDGSDTVSTVLPPVPHDLKQ
ncbi:hypothetical protein GS501_04860 [Saccharibacter sp. 17.LH.SD]|uniref:hypothetical protein n=1 Tax=Saccharibacter sp. 17.LH.SD TaxID=2689393 RepID=UPI00136C8C84|nr:hypothetical protein [Saccharibacter sp. 17.LH.SD]MXV44377.1 hypothetical protein [Saccharibacter sp. 17.LH.SD]